MSGFRERCNRLLDTALRPHVFGDSELLNYLPKAGGSFFIRCIFDDAWEGEHVNSEVIISSTSISIGISKTEIEDKGISPKIGDKLIRESVKYVVVDVLEDGQDGLLLPLNKAPE
jgi:hypothetical protein